MRLGTTDPEPRLRPPLSLEAVYSPKSSLLMVPSQKILGAFDELSKRELTMHELEAHTGVPLDLLRREVSLLAHQGLVYVHRVDAHLIWVSLR